MGVFATSETHVEKSCTWCSPMEPITSNDIFCGGTSARRLLRLPAGTPERVRKACHLAASARDLPTATTDPLIARTRRSHAANLRDLG
jgi:hypothetical protein